MRLPQLRAPLALSVILVAAAAFGAAEPAHAADDERWAPPVAGPESATSFAYVPTATEVERVAGRRPCYGRRPSARRWTFDFAVPIWIPGVSGSFAEGGIEIEADPETDKIVEDFFDVTSDLKFGFLGSFSAHKGKWSFVLDGFGVRLGTGVSLKLTNGQLVDGEIYTLILRPTVRYRFLNKPVCIPGTGRGCLSVDALVGARYYKVGFDVDLPFGINLEGDQDWIDPIVGFDARLDLSRKWAIRLESDVGGFGVGSDFAWWVIGSVEWRFARRWTLMGGYAWADVSYGEVRDFAWDITLSGPMLGIKFSF
jgi:hypothetical protein